MNDGDGYSERGKEPKRSFLIVIVTIYAFI